MNHPAGKLLGMEVRGDHVVRTYRRADGHITTTYEIDASNIFPSDLRALVRKAQSLKENHGRRKHTLGNDPDKVDAVLADIEAGLTHREVATKHGVSTKTVQRIKWGYRR